MTPKEEQAADKIKVLLVDDSLVFRRFLGDIFNDCENIEIVGEAENGIEALDMILKVSPDVILLDMEMPLMDGMTALQHLMIHRPTPVLMFSSLSEEGTARCFDTLKNGAVDFLCKDFIFEQSNLKSRKSLIISKVEKAGRMKIKPRDPVLSKKTGSGKKKDKEMRVVFCEECGSRQNINVRKAGSDEVLECTTCGDIIDFALTGENQYKNNNFITLLAGGYGAYFNLLELLPGFKGNTGGALIVVIDGKTSHVNNFAEYLDAISSMKIVRAGEGTNIEGGGCYILSNDDLLTLKPTGTNVTLQKVSDPAGKGTLDIILASMSTLYKNRAAAVILSGEKLDGDQGLAMLQKNGGSLEVLAPNECYCTELGKAVKDKLMLTEYKSCQQIIESIENNHLQEKL